MARKPIKPRIPKAQTAEAIAARRTENQLDALDLTHDTRNQLKLLITLLRTEDGVLMLDEQAVCGLVTWLGLIDDNLRYIAVRIDPEFDPAAPVAA